jgi:hypothetical protein
MITPTQQIARLEYVVREQMAEIDRLRAEVSNLVGWIMDDRDALATLQAIYTDREASEANRIKAAAAAIGFERPKVAGTTNVLMIDFRERVRQARLKAPYVETKVIEPLTIEHEPRGDPAA